MPVPSVLTHQDIVSEILSFLPSCCRFRAICKAFFRVARSVGTFCLWSHATKCYLENATFRAYVNRIVLHPRTQLEICCFFAPCDIHWRPEYAAVLAAVKTVQIFVFADVAPLLPWSKLKHIRRVDFCANTHTQECAVSVLGELPSLVHLTLGMQEVDLRGVEKLVNLKKLYVEQSDRILNGHCLANLTNLETLNLQVDDVDFNFLDRANFACLRYLRLDIEAPLNFSFLAKCASLEEIYSSNFSSDLSVLGFCKNLERASLRNLRADDVSPLTKCRKLKSLTLSSMSGDFSALAHIPSLEHLDLMFTSFSDLSILKQLPKLRSLDIRHAPITEIDALPEFPVLERLCLSKCQIKCYIPISHCPRLVECTTDDRNSCFSHWRGVMSSDSEYFKY